MSDYYTDDELDAMPVGTILPDVDHDPLVKARQGEWVELGRTWKQDHIQFPTPLGSATTADNHVHPTPTLGELVALRESYRKELQHCLEMTGKVELGDSYRNMYGEQSDAVQKQFDHVDRLIDARLDLS